MGWVDFSGITDKYMMENGVIIKNMEVDNGYPIIYPMSVNGNIILYKDLVY